jgi:hypothetical protein
MLLWINDLSGSKQATSWTGGKVANTQTATFPWMPCAACCAVFAVAWEHPNLVQYMGGAGSVPRITDRQSYLWLVAFLTPAKRIPCLRLKLVHDRFLSPICGLFYCVISNWDFTILRGEMTDEWCFVRNGWRHIGGMITEFHLEFLKESTEVVTALFINQYCFLNLLKSTGYGMHQEVKYFNNCTHCPHSIYVFCICLWTNSDLYHLQHKLISFNNRNEKCLQRGTDSAFKWSSLRSVF